jgi:hypothetical protein
VRVELLTGDLGDPLVAEAGVDVIARATLRASSSSSNLPVALEAAREVAVEADVARPLVVVKFAVDLEVCRCAA